MPSTLTADELRKLFPHASASTLAANAQDRPAGLRPVEPKQTQQPTLDENRRGKRASAKSPHSRYFVTFTIYATHPMDWDNPNVKHLQDQLVRGGLIPSDDWHTLEGCVKSRKANTKAEERTEIEIEQL